MKLKLTDYQKKFIRKVRRSSRNGVTSITIDFGVGKAKSLKLKQ